MSAEDWVTREWADEVVDDAAFIGNYPAAREALRFFHDRLVLAERLLAEYPTGTGARVGWNIRRGDFLVERSRS